MFFFHSKTKKSFWQLPDELKDVALPEPQPEHRIAAKKGDDAQAGDKRTAQHDEEDERLAERSRLALAPAPSLLEMKCWWPARMRQL